VQGIHENAANPHSGSQATLSAGTATQVRRGDHSVQDIADLLVAGARRITIGSHDPAHGIESIAVRLSSGLHYFTILPTVAGMPFVGNWHVTIEVWNVNNIFITAKPLGAIEGHQVWIKNRSYETWAGWKQISGNTPRIALPLAAGFSAISGSDNLYHKTSNLVTVNFSLRRTTDITHSMHIATLPVGFRPVGLVYGFIGGNTGTVTPVLIFNIYPDGRIITAGMITVAGVRDIHGSISFTTTE